LFKLPGRQIIPFVLCVDKKEQDGFLCSKPILYDPDASAFPMALGEPAELAQAPASLYELARIGLVEQVHL
jgi:hypothetical protein